jgi:hypothetical protein
MRLTGIKKVVLRETCGWSLDLRLSTKPAENSKNNQSDS